MMIYDQFCVSKCYIFSDHSHDAVSFGGAQAGHH